MPALLGKGLAEERWLIGEAIGFVDLDAEGCDGFVGETDFCWGETTGWGFLLSTLTFNVVVIFELGDFCGSFDAGGGFKSFKLKKEITILSTRTD